MNGNEYPGISITGRPNISWNNPNPPYDFIRWYNNVDLSDYDYLEFYAKKGADHGKMYIYIDNQKLEGISYANFNQYWMKYTLDVKEYNGEHEISFVGGYTDITGAAIHEFDIQFTKTNVRQLMGYGGSWAEYWGVKDNGYYEIYQATSFKAGNRDIIRQDFGETTSGKVILYVNGQNAFSITNSDSTIKNSSQYNYSLFKIYNINDYYSSAKLYSYRAYHNDQLIRDMIPCYSTTTITNVNNRQCLAGTIGLYDLVEGKFYTNQGSGTFSKGNDV